MFWITVILALAAAAATVFFLVRGLAAFLRGTEAALNEEGGISIARDQNKAMQGRVAMQAVAVFLSLLALALLS